VAFSLSFNSNQSQLILYMASVFMSGLSDEEKALIEQRADEAGMDVAAFVRTRFRAGWRLWDAGGDFDVLEMHKRLGEEAETQQTSEPTEPASVASQDRFSKQIKRNLPTAEDDAVPIDELQATVSQEVVTDVLDELRDAGEVEYITGKGYVRVE
jgi:hypothetical protein